MRYLKILAVSALALILALPLIILSASAIEPVHNASDEYRASEYYANLSSLSLTGDQRTDIVLVALSQLGYHEGNSDADMGGGNTGGSRNFAEYNRLHGIVDNNEGNGTSYGYAWCCSFATWCLKQAGVSDSVIKKEISCLRLVNWLTSQSKYKTRQSGYTPRTGDLIFFNDSTPSAISTHVGIVRYVSGSTVYTIEGNPSTDNVALKSYALSNTRIVGYSNATYTSKPESAINFDMAGSGGYLAGTYFINTAELNVRSGPGTSYGIIGGLKYSQKVTVTADSNGWGKIDYNGKEGWIYLLDYTHYVPSARFTIYYNANGGSSAPSAQPKSDGVSTTITTAAPTRAGYNFAGWSTSKSATTAQYAPGSVFTDNADTILYAVWATGNVTIKFFNGTTMLSTASYAGGAQVTLPAAPTKDADNTYKYTFIGWDKNSDGKVDIAPGEIITAAANTDYYAVFESAYIDYKITFYGRDGVTVIEEKLYHYGDTVTIPTPETYNEGRYTYTFSGWNNTVAATVGGNASYIALFTESTAKYTVEFIDGNGNVFESGEYEYGHMPKIPTSPPTKNTDETYTYTFAGWDSAVGNVLADTIYQAVFYKTYINYNVIFIDGDGNTFHSTTAHYGDPIPTPTKVPTKAADEIYKYEFEGWENIDFPVTGDTVLDAQFKSILRVYTVTFFNEDGTLFAVDEYNYGDTIIPPDAPTKTAATGYYSFGGWSPEITTVTGNLKFTATFIYSETRPPDTGTDDQKPGDDDNGGITAGTVISVVAVLIAAAGFIAYITIRKKKSNYEEP